MDKMIKLLGKDDLSAWKSLRLEALQSCPEAFGSSYEEEVRHTDAEWESGLKRSNIFGAFVDGMLVAAAGFFVMDRLKTKHRGILFGTYTKPSHRRKGFASSVVEAIVAHAKEHVLQVHLTCHKNNLAPLSLYQKHGFKIYGTEPKSLKIGDKFYDEHLMVLELIK